MRLAKVSRTATRLLIGVIVVAIVLIGGYFAFFNGAPDKTVQARFTAAVGVYPGTPVKILGVQVGTVSAVHPHGSYVAVTMTYDNRYQLPAKVGAVEVANSLVSDRYIQLAPVYKGGPMLASGGLIPVAHTGAPAELDDIYSALRKLSVALGPQGANKGGKSKGALSALVDVASANLKGNGAALGNSIAKLSQAAQTLSNGRSNLFGTVRNLRRFTATLKASDTQVRKFNEQLAQVAGDLASERTDLGAALKDLGLALDDVNHFVKSNAGKFHTDIKGLRTITGVLVRQKASLTETLAVAPVALANIVHAYLPEPGVLATRSNLASLTDPNGLPAVVCGLLDKAGGGLPGALKGLGSGLTKQVIKTCNDVSKGLPVGGSPPTLPGLPSLPGTVGGGS